MSRYHLICLLLIIMPGAFAQDGHVHNQATMPVTPDIAPPNARDPDAYSAGFTQTQSPYTLIDAQPMSHAEQAPIVTILGDHLEYDSKSNTGIYGLQAWYGSQFNRLVIKSEGSFSNNNEYENQTELLWSHALTAFWDSQIGVRADTQREGSNRNWLAIGIQGLAPYWFELDATAYLSSGGQTELKFDSEYDLRLTQRLILQPRADFTLRGKTDTTDALGSGLANASLSIRLRYEFSRQFAPFIGVETEKHFGTTAQLMSDLDEPIKNTRYFAGIRFWF